MILTIINFNFILSILPAIVQNYRMKDAKGQSLITYVSTSVLLTIVSLIFITLDFLLSAISTAEQQSLGMCYHTKKFYTPLKPINSEDI